MGQNKSVLIIGDIYKLDHHGPGFYKLDHHGPGSCVCVLRSINKDIGINVDIVCYECCSYLSESNPKFNFFWSGITGIKRFDLRELPLCLGYKFKSFLFYRLMKGESLYEQVSGGLTTTETRTIPEGA